MGEMGRYGSQLPHDKAAQRAHFKEVDEDLRADQEADRLAKGRSTRPRWGVGYFVVLAGSAGFVASSFVPYYGGGVGPGFGTVSLHQQGSFGDSVGWYLGSLLFLFGGVATVALLAIAGVTRRGPRTAATMLAATVVAWSLTWTGLMIRDITFGLEVTLEWGFWVHAVSVGVVAIGTIVVVATQGQERIPRTRRSQTSRLAVFGAAPDAPYRDRHVHEGPHGSPQIEPNPSDQHAWHLGVHVAGRSRHLVLGLRSASSSASTANPCSKRHVRSRRMTGVTRPGSARVIRPAYALPFQDGDTSGSPAVRN